MEELKQIDGQHPYPHKFDVTLSLVDFVENYNHLNAGEKMEDLVSVAGK